MKDVVDSSTEKAPLPGSGLENVEANVSAGTVDSSRMHQQQRAIYLVEQVVRNFIKVPL